ncbi:MAG: response regulator [Deltaproteobacteria bacterium]|nr:response regulator [Deltaproteobacteria bacterium]
MVYLIEDDESVRKALQRLLRSAAIETRVFASAEEFLQGGEIDQGACLIVDIQMQGLTGFELQEELRSKKIWVPTIVISALDDAETRERARKLGAKAFFRKPVDGQALIDSIHWAMGDTLNSACPSDS